jgi:hypothetical protein
MDWCTYGSLMKGIIVWVVVNDAFAIWINLIVGTVLSNLFPDARFFVGM